MSSANTSAAYALSRWGDDADNETDWKYDNAETEALPETLHRHELYLVPQCLSEPRGEGAYNTEAVGLIERFQDLTWQNVVPIATLLMTLVIGVLACGQFLAYGV
jgi:hypothetical protein